MKKSVLRIAAVVLFALVIFINVSHGHVKAFQGNKNSEAAEATNAIEGDGVLAVATDSEESETPTIENIEYLGAGAGAPTIASTEAVEVAEAKTDNAADTKTEPAIVEKEKTSVAEADTAAGDIEPEDIDRESIDTEEAGSEAADTESSDAGANAEDTDVLAGRSEPKTAGKDIPIVLFAVFALLADFFLVLIENANGMDEEDKAAAIKKIKSHVRPNDKLSQIKAYVEVFTLLLYYHTIGKYIKKNKNYA